MQQREICRCHHQRVAGNWHLKISSGSPFDVQAPNQIVNTNNISGVVAR